MKVLSKVMTMVLLTSVFVGTAKASSRSILESDYKIGNDCLSVAKTAGYVLFKLSTGNGVQTPMNLEINPSVSAETNEVTVTVKGSQEKTYVMNVKQTAEACEIKSIVER